ncbi:MAG: stage 0 sporulation family protein [Nitrospirae bacterium]|nr:stage 0 sporulation family protein [Nitrospirota bacterium]
MPEIVGIKFKQCGKAYDFEANNLELKVGDNVVVESDFGISIGRVVTEKKSLEQSDRQFKKVIRHMNENDKKTKEENVKIEKDARDYCRERIMVRGLPMKLVGAESTLDRKRIVFYFTADGRIDFRELVKDLAAKFKTRIEMRQIGVRDEARFIGGIGICGRTLCCSTFLSSFEPVSIKMAKKQELTLNVGKLSGQCGRLMCCLRYEYEGRLEGITLDEEIPAEIGEKDKSEPEVMISQVLSRIDENGHENRPAPDRKAHTPNSMPNKDNRQRGRRDFREQQKPDTKTPQPENQPKTEGDQQKPEKPHDRRPRRRRRPKK